MQNQQNQPQGQQAQQPQGPPVQQQNVNQANNWDFWPEVLPAISQQVIQEEEEAVDLQQPALLQDLNVVPELEDLAEVIIHPPQAAVPQAQINDLDWGNLDVEIEMEIVQPVPQQQLVPVQPEDPPQLPAFNMGNQNNFLSHEIPEDALMNDAELAGPEPHLWGMPEDVNDLQVGMVKIVEVTPPIMQQFSKSSVPFPWEKPPPKINGAFSVEVPQEWAAFLFALLQNPSHFVWAKQFIMSSSISALSPGGPTVLIEIPKKLPNNAQLACCKLSERSPISSEEMDYLADDSPSQTDHLSPDSLSSPKSQEKSEKSGKAGNISPKEHLVDSDRRRSNRLKIRNKGFKQSPCGKANCVGCSSKPPTLSNSIIRNLGKELCQIDPELLSDEILLKKKEAGVVEAKKKAGKGSKTMKKKEEIKDKNGGKKDKKNED